jgi:CRISPR/Cas system CMR-associated protein Cmr1 (group 7 of RAMP superfamily)
METLKSLELISLEALQKDLQTKISEKEIEMKNEIDKMKRELQKTKTAILDYKKKKFFEKYELTVDEVYIAYVKRMGSCCYQGGEGYSWWLPYTSKPDYHHCVIKPSEYKNAQPTEMEREAYKIEHGREMEVTQKMHYERWGN